MQTLWLFYESIILFSKFKTKNYKWKQKLENNENDDDEDDDAAAAK